VNVAQEMARMTSANRVYEANLSAVEATKSMAQRTFEI
jgi:flagellar basal-body rod protein FlgC